LNSFDKIFEASQRKCGACGETGHNARTCKSKSVPFSTGGYWNEKTFDGLEQLGFPLVDSSHVAMISKIVDGEVLKEPNARVQMPRITWKEEPIKMTWGELDEKCKKQDLVSIGESTYSGAYLRGALAYLPKNTVLTLYTGVHYPLKATFEYGGEEWIFFLAPRVDNWYAENLEDWSEQEMTSHGKNVSFKDFIKKEIKSHGNIDIVDWAKHEKQSHKERYGVESFSLDSKRNQSKYMAETFEAESPARMSQEELLEFFNSLTPKEEVLIWYNSGIRRGDDWTPMTVGRRSESKKYNLKKISLTGKQGGKFTLYNRQGKISLAMGDMATVLIAVKKNDIKNAEIFGAEGGGGMTCNDKLNEAYDWIGFHNGEENLRKFMDSIGIKDEDLDAETFESEERMCLVCGCKEDLVFCCGDYWCNDERCSTKESRRDEPYPKSEESCWAKHADYGYCDGGWRNAETFESSSNNCPICKGNTTWGESIGDEDADICGNCSVLILPDDSDRFKVSCSKCGFGDPDYSIEPPCNVCEPIAKQIENLNKGAETFGADALVEEPDFIPDGDGRALGQQTSSINLSPLHAETEEAFGSVGEGNNFGQMRAENKVLSKTNLVIAGVIGLGIWKGKQILDTAKSSLKQSAENKKERCSTCNSNGTIRKNHTQVKQSEYSVNQINPVEAEGQNDIHGAEGVANPRHAPNSQPFGYPSKSLKMW